MKVVFWHDEGWTLELVPKLTHEEKIEIFARKIAPK
jgi:hypothetical protein